MCIVPSEVCPENMIPDRFDNFSDKQKRPVLGLFCPFMAQKPIFLYVFWNKNSKIGTDRDDLAFGTWHRIIRPAML